MSGTENRWAVAILAAGKGTRMRSDRPKVLHELAGRPLVDHVVDLALAVARPHDVVVVVGHGAGEVGELVGSRGASAVVQEPQLGTGDALRVALGGLAGRPAERLLVLSGDVPLLRARTLERLMAAAEGGAAAVLLTAELDDPGAYGRVIRGADGAVEAVVEARDASFAELAVREVNAGIYAFDRAVVAEALAGLGTDNAQGEVYLTDVAAALRAAGHRVAAVRLDDPVEMQGINTRADLAEAERVLNRMVLDGLMAAGVTIRDPRTTWVDPRAEIGRDTVVEPGVVIRGRCRIGGGARIGANSVLDNAAVAAGEQVRPLTFLTGE
ncbi:MAG: NTP transferase domain-containing protein [Thermoanaerobaculales bacterium]|nr:NTP transferase domain-containing protein [Thermoanaerobaculales bacterium]